MTEPTRARYETDARRWRDTRTADTVLMAAATAMVEGAGDRPVVDLGCGPGWHLPDLGPRAVGLDRSAAMLALAREHAAPLVQADVAALPFRSGSLGGALSSRTHVHLPREAVPAALADLHRCLTVDALVELVVFEGSDPSFRPFPDDDFPDRRFSTWEPDLLDRVVVGAGFEPVDAAPARRALHLRLRRLRTLPDTVGPALDVLVCGLNPSLHAADAGVGFVSPSNRFWRAAGEAGLVSVDRDPWHALRHHRVGMTDLVKRATPRASELHADEYRAGFARVEALVDWLRPRAVLFVGLSGYRAAVDRRAVAGWQPRVVGAAPAYVMPSTSGLNASSSLEDLVAHLRTVRNPPAR